MVRYEAPNTDFVKTHTAAVSATLLERELLVGAADGEVEALIVVVGVRVGGAAGSAALLVVGAGSVGGSADLGSGVRGGAAGGGRLADLERLALRPFDGASKGEAQKRSQGNEGLQEELTESRIGAIGSTDLEDKHIVG